MNGDSRNSSYINHFIQPDSIIPDPVNPQAFNRYSYVGNNPINFNDPSGHVMTQCGDGGSECGGRSLNGQSTSSSGCNVIMSCGSPATKITFTPPEGWQPTYIGSAPRVNSSSYPWESNLSGSNFSYLWSSWFGGSDIYSFRSGGFSPVAKFGNFGFSGNGLWGLNGHYYTGTSISTAFLENTLKGALPGSIFVALIGNTIDYSIGPNR